MSKKKAKKTEPADAPRFDEAAAAQITARPLEEHVPCPPDEKAAAAENEQPCLREPETESEVLKSLQSELQEAKDRALRSQAELENYRKRVARNVQEERRYANLPLIRDLLPVLDNMDRAIEAAEKTFDAESLLRGVKMVAQQLQDVLQKYDCVQIQALNEPFDPHLHEAISQQPTDEIPGGTVLQVTQTGFQLHGRVVRPSQVVVSTENHSEE